MAWDKSQPPFRGEMQPNRWIKIMPFEATHWAPEKIIQEKCGVGHEKMVTSQVKSKSLGQRMSVGSWLCAGKNSRTSHSKLKEGLFREIHSPQTVRAILESERHQGMGLSVFIGWVISQANKWEDYYNYFGEGEGISRNWVTTQFLTFYGQPQNCHGAGGCVIQLADVLQ